MLVFDGPIEPTWVENLNSVLDDNRKLYYGNGDWLPLTPKMRVVLEASDLSQCSPATVSRCGVVYMEDGEEVIPLKSHVNSWMKKMPEILETELDRFDLIVNFFISQIKEDYIDPMYLIHPISKK
jgi:dynein heavy chain, axonemal